MHNDSISKPSRSIRGSVSFDDNVNMAYQKRSRDNSYVGEEQHYQQNNMKRKIGSSMIKK